VVQAKRKLENEFQPKLKEAIRKRFPGCYIFKLDSSEFQGIPDLLILWNDRWAILEVKREPPTGAKDYYRPNQEWYIDTFNNLSFSSVVYPENKEEVLNAIQQTFRTRRSPRHYQRQQVSLD
jgi:hypothetical protein